MSIKKATKFKPEELYPATDGDENGEDDPVYHRGLAFGVEGNELSRRSREVGYISARLFFSSEKPVALHFGIYPRARHCRL